MQSATTHHEDSSGQKKPVFWIFVAAFIGLGLFFAVNSLFLGKSKTDLNPEDPARDAERIKILADLQAESQLKLNTYAWVDQGKGSVQIPIAEAMKLVIADLNAKKPTPAYPVLDATGKPLPASTPESDTSDNLPSESAATNQSSSNVLAAPVEPAIKPAKIKKSANP